MNFGRTITNAKEAKLCGMMACVITDAIATELVSAPVLMLYRIKVLMTDSVPLYPVRLLKRIVQREIVIVQSHMTAIVNVAVQSHENLAWNSE